MLPTPEQRRVLDAVRDQRENVAVDAVAGAGKTTTIVSACRVAGPRTGFLAFNKHIAGELKTRLAGTAEASTMHGLGFACLNRARPGIQLNDRKTRDRLKVLFPKLHREGRGKWKGRLFLSDDWAGLPDAVAVCKQQCASPADDPADVESACWRQGVDLPADADQRKQFFGYVAETVAAAADDTDSCDFDDMIWLPVRLGLVRPEFATLFVDEVQDLNPAQQQLAIAAGDRVNIVGDPRQAIMGFAGADTRGFPRMCERLAGGRGLLQLPLTNCFRCPESHLRLAQLLVPHIQPGAFADEGTVEEVPAARLVAGAVPGDMVICRNTAPLLILAYRMIAAKVPILVRGRKIGDNLRDLVQGLKASGPADLLSRLSAWEVEQRDKLEAADAPTEAVEALTDRAGSLRALAQNASSLGELFDLLDSLFSDNDPAGKVLLSSVHRSKGLEANRVWIYEPGLMPGRAGEPQELNLLYVALTRAKQSLFLVDDEVRRKDSAATWVAKVAAGESKFDLTERRGGL